MPGSPPKALQSRVLAGKGTIFVTWEAPEKPNGRILDYVIYYTTRESDPLSFWSKMNVSETSAQILSAQREMLYTIQVAARNSIGYGPMSVKSQVMTTPGSKNNLLILKTISYFFFSVPGQPTNLKATPLSGDKVQLTWDPPLYASGDIVQYVIVYNSSSTDPQSSSSTGGNVISQEMTIQAHNIGTPKATVENLKPNSNYSFHVIGVSSRGKGVPSASVTARTSPAGKLFYFYSVE